MKNLNDYLQLFVEHRIDEIGGEMLRRNRQFNKYSAEQRKCFNALLNNLPESCKVILFEYEETVNAQAALGYERMYRQGFLDGLGLDCKLNRIKTITYDGLFGVGNCVR